MSSTESTGLPSTERPSAVPESRVITCRGRDYVIRPLRPDDVARLQEFFYSHTPETIQMRYGYAITSMTSERAHDLVNVDQTRDLALGIFEMSGGAEIIHAVGRYCLDGDERSAEVAFVVRENARRCGMASTLLDALHTVARARGLARLWGRVRKDNHPMLALFKRHGGKPVASGEAGTGDVDISIPVALDPSSTESTKKRQKRKSPDPPPSALPRTRKRG